MFYANTHTGLTQWVPPTSEADAKAEAQAKAEAEAKAKAEAGLPAGWIEQYDSKTGRVFYANSQTGQTQWTRPDEPAPEPPPEMVPVCARAHASFMHACT